MYEILKLDYYKITLDNGLEVILYKNSSLPIVSVNIWYKVGSANEKPGKTGFAHLFEHMMFQGSKNIPKKMHFKYIQQAGGSLNGSTSFDRTNYFETIPSNSLEMALWLESDRMGFLLHALTGKKLENQKNVVMNERRQRYENQPYGLAWEKIFSNLYHQNHPYHWPTIGWMEDIMKFELDDVRNFFKTYYVSNNASLVIGGDIDEKKTLKLVEKYFSTIKMGNDIPKVFSEPVLLNRSKKIDYYDNVQLPRIYFAWSSDKLYGKDDAALDVLSNIIAGSKNSRLQKRLLFNTQTAQDVTAFQFSAKINGSFLIFATAKSGVNLDTLKNIIFEELEKIISNGITDDELLRSKNSIKSSFIYSLQHQSTMIDHINNYNCMLGEPDSFLYDLNRYENLKKEDILKVAKNYLNQPYIELNVLPREVSNVN